MLPAVRNGLKLSVTGSAIPAWSEIALRTDRGRRRTAESGRNRTVEQHLEALAGIAATGLPSGTCGPVSGRREWD